MKKVSKIVMGLVILVLVAILFFAIDYSRAQNQKRSIFSILNPAGVINEGEIIIFTGSYGGYTTKAKANTITGEFIDIYGNIYNYQIPCDEKENMRVPVGRIDEEVLKKYKGDYVSTLSKEDLDIILNNMNNISNEYEKRTVPITDMPSSFKYIIVDGNIKILMTSSGGGNVSIRENSSEAGKKILEIILKNNI